METRSIRRRLLDLGLLFGLVLLIRLPFMDQAIGGDDPYYIFGAQHALIDPAHPGHARYVYHGEVVDMRGHPHPPLNSWVLAALIAALGDVYEVPFHWAYLAFSLIAAASVYVLAARWSTKPLWAALLFVATPAFVVNGNSFEADVPFVAWWLLGFACFVHARWIGAALALALAAMTAYQAVVATPILLLHAWLHQRSRKAAWIVALTPLVVVGAYQMYERITGGTLPATVLAGYFSSYGLQQIANKLRNAAALTAHTSWLVFPLAALFAFRSRWPVFVIACLAGALIDTHPLFWASFGVGAAVLTGCVQRRPDWLQSWILIFFAAALVLFFAGSARYLLPIAAPVATLAATRLSRTWLAGAVVCNVALGLALAQVNYTLWDGYRDFVRSIPDAFGDNKYKVWVNGELGLRYYVENAGGLPVRLDRALYPGEWVIESQLAFPISLNAPLSRLADREIKPYLPLRIVGLEAKSGYSSVAFGLRPFDFDTGPIDRVRSFIVRPRTATARFFLMNEPEAAQQIVTGVYQLEGATRWMSRRAVLTVAPPLEARPVEVQLYLHPQGRAREARILIDGDEVAREKLPASGLHTIRTKPVTGTTVSIELDQTFRVPGDNRELGAVLVGAGYR